MRWLSGFLVLGLVCAVSGCATLALSEGGYTHYHRTETVVVEDQVIGIGEVRAPKWVLPDEIPLMPVRGKPGAWRFEFLDTHAKKVLLEADYDRFEGQWVDIEQHASAGRAVFKAKVVKNVEGAFGLVPVRALEHVPTLVLVGGKHSYVVDKGGYEIAQIAQNLDGNRVRLDMGSHEALVLRSLMGQDERGHAVRLFEGGLVVVYDKSEVELSDAERGFLKRLNFEQSATGFRKHLLLEGAVYPSVVNAAGMNTSFKQSRSIRLVEQGGFSTPKLWKFAALPVGVAFDVVTAPIWLAYLLMNPLKIGF